MMTNTISVIYHAFIYIFRSLEIMFFTSFNSKIICIIKELVTND